MRITASVLSAIVVFLTIMTTSASAFSLIVTSDKDGSVMLMADNDAGGVERVELSMTYPQEFSAPRATIPIGDHSGERLIDEAKPGFLKLSFNRGKDESHDSGFAVIVKFDKKPADQPCPVKSVNAKYFYTSGEVAIPDVDLSSIVTQKTPVSQSAAVRGKTQSAPAGGGGSAAASAKPTLPPLATTDKGKPEESEVGKPSEQNREDEDEKPSFVQYIGSLEYQTCLEPLQRFMKYRSGGEEAGLLPLFASGRPCGCRQTPPVAISDGLGKVSLTFRTEGEKDKAPSIVLTGARFISLEKKSGNSWTVELVPYLGERDVVLYVFTGNVLRRIPLTVAPPLKLYLQDIRPGSSPQQMLDYVVAANYLAAESKVTPPSLPLR